MKIFGISTFMWFIIVLIVTVINLILLCWKSIELATLESEVVKS